MEAPRLVSIHQVSDGWIKKYILVHEMPDGSLHEYEVASRKGIDSFRALMERNAAGERPGQADAVCIAARTPNNAMLMIREFRYPLNSWCIAFPAGLVEPGEDLVACADRELQEETGYRIVPGSKAHALPQAGYSSTGLTDEAVQVIFVEAERAGQPRTEPSELIEVFELPIPEIRRFLDANELPIGTRAQLVLEIIAREALM